MTQTLYAHMNKRKKKTDLRKNLANERLKKETFSK
jgi:hypothetical protein